RGLVGERGGWGCGGGGAGGPVSARPGLEVAGLQDQDGQGLLRSVVQWPLDEQVRERILAETKGNPLALLELPRGLSPTQLAGGFGVPDELSLPGRIEGRFLRRGGAPAGGAAGARTASGA